MCSSESLILGLEGIKNGVCDLESRTSEFAETLLAAFLNGTDTETEVENEMAMLTEAIGQLKEIIQTIEAKIRQNAAGGDNVKNIKLEVEDFQDEMWEVVVPDVMQSMGLIESDSCSVNAVIFNVRSLETESKELKNSYSHEGVQEGSADDPGRSYKRSRTRKTGFSKSVRTGGRNLSKSKPTCASTLMDEAHGKKPLSHLSYTSSDSKLKQEVKVSLTRLPEKELLSSFPSSLTGETPIKRAAAVKALNNFRKSKSSDSESSEAGDEPEDFTSDVDFDNDEEINFTGNNSQCVSQNQSSKLDEEKIVGNSVKSPCPKCGVMLVSGRMKIHVKLHDDPTVFNFVCSICSVRFVSEGHFRTHQLSHESTFNCPHCETKYGTQGGLELHMTRKHSTNTSDAVMPGAVNQICRWCLKEKSYKNKLGFAFHEARCLRVLGNSKNPDEGPWKCSKDECSQRTPFSNVLEFKIHMKSGVHPSPSDQDCLMQETHEKSEVEKEVFNCPKCNEPHGSKSFFNHIKFCLCGGHQGTSVKCPLCEVEFALHKYLVEHLKMHQRKDRSPNISRLFHCSKCDKRFAHEKTYLRHNAVTHSSDRPFSCNKCPFTCKLKILLKNHLRSMHLSQENPPRQRVICEQCGHTFAEKKNLNGHIRQVHLEIRPYSCTLCDKRFKVRSHLDYHLKTHDNPNVQKRSLNKPRRKPVYRTGPPIASGCMTGP